MSRHHRRVLKEYLKTMRQAAIFRTQRIAMKGEVAHGWHASDAPQRLSRAITERNKILKLIKEQMPWTVTSK